MMERIDREGIKGDLELVTASATPPEPAEFRAEWAPAQAGQDDAFAALPVLDRRLARRWSSSRGDFLDRGALLMAPLNPARYGDAVGFLRVGRYGYGAAPR